MHVLLFCLSLLYFSKVIADNSDEERLKSEDKIDDGGLPPS
jgi:hypothetical protein